MSVWWLIVSEAWTHGPSDTPVDKTHWGVGRRHPATGWVLNSLWLSPLPAGGCTVTGCMWLLSYDVPRRCSLRLLHSNIWPGQYPAAMLPV